VVEFKVTTRRARAAIERNARTVTNLLSNTEAARRLSAFISPRGD
jgi:hypothetical protein